MTNWGSLAAALCLVCLSGDVMVTAFTRTQPKPMKSDFADFVVKAGYGPQFTSGKTSVLMPKSSESEYRNFYEILGVTRQDDDKTIKKSYRQRAKMYHPGESSTLCGKRLHSLKQLVSSICLPIHVLNIVTDINPDEEAMEMFQEVIRAFEVLRDPELKKLYDWYGKSGIGTSAHSDDVTSQEAAEIEDLQYGDISSSFGACLDPKGFHMKKEAKKFHEKRRYVMHRNHSFSSIQTKLKKDRQKEEASKGKGKHAFGQFYDPKARTGFSP
jgi:curved DNA-binding protein CbpA